MHWFWEVQYVISVIVIVFNILCIIGTHNMTNEKNKDSKYYTKLGKMAITIIVLVIYIWILRRYGVVK